MSQRAQLFQSIEMGHRFRAVWGVLAVASISAFLLTACGASAPTPEQTRGGFVSPRAAEHIVIVVNTPSAGPMPANVGYITDELAARGMGVMTLPPATDTESISQSVIATVDSLQRDPATATHPVVLLAIGHDATEVWRVLAAPPEGLVASVTINVPGVPDLDFSGGLAVASLSLNLESDVLATDGHHEVHEAMSAAGTLHQVIVYGDVRADALDQGSPGWDEATAHDAAVRTADWLQHRDGFMDQNMENPEVRH